ncbi:MAG TPA: hypothetical protein VGD89_07160 [Flavipsychrobacter sp.]
MTAHTNKSLWLLALPLVLFSCKAKKEDMLAKRWVAVSVENPQLDAQINEQQVFLDTFGKNSDAATNLAIYGITNIDSARESLRAQLNDYKAMQQHAVENTWFHFRKDGIVQMNFSGQIDSTKWYFEEDSLLVLDEQKLKGAGTILKMDVIQLTDTSLKLKFNENGMNSTVLFHPDKK